MWKYPAALLLAMMAMLPVRAEQVAKVGQYDIHYVAFDSAFITPEVAQSYDITRSRYIGLINITVLDTDVSAGNPQAVEVNINGSARNLVGNSRELAFKEVREGDAIYYLAEVPFRNEESFTFDLNINNGSDLNSHLSFKQKFYVD